jgi:dCMP deaminase
MLIPKDEFYMNICKEIAKASHAERNKVGALLVKGGNIIAFGYNGTPAGFDNKCEYTVNKPLMTNVTEYISVTKPEVLHAESNAIVKCARSTANSEGATLYCNFSPCFECAKLIIQAGIVRVIYVEEYRDPAGLALLTQADIKHIKL